MLSWKSLITSCRQDKIIRKREKKVNLSLIKFRETKIKEAKIKGEKFNERKRRKNLQQQK